MLAKSYRSNPTANHYSLTLYIDLSAQLKSTQTSLDQPSLISEPSWMPLWINLFFFIARYRHLTHTECFHLLLSGRLHATQNVRGRLWLFCMSLLDERKWHWIVIFRNRARVVFFKQFLLGVLIGRWDWVETGKSLVGPEDVVNLRFVYLKRYWLTLGRLAVYRVVEKVLFIAWLLIWASNLDKLAFPFRCWFLQWICWQRRHVCRMWKINLWVQ